MSKPKKHYQSSSYIVMPVSGKHVYSLCGRMFQCNVAACRERLTESEEQVTCKQCLKRLKDIL